MKRLLLVLLVTAVILGAGCARAPDINANITPLEAPSQIIKDIAPKEAFDLIQSNKNNPDFLIIDVRTPAEFASGHIENAINLDYYAATFRDELNKLAKDKTYLIYCRSGVRSAGALDTMKELGFKKAYNMLGGISQWQKEELPTVK